MNKTQIKHKVQDILIDSMVNWGATIEQLEDLQLDERTHAEMHQELQKQASRIYKFFGYKDIKPEGIRFG